MPSFLIRGLARYFAASEMERRERRRSSYTSSSDDSPVKVTHLSDSTFYLWQSEMRWLLPFVQATGCKIVIDNPKSHEQLVIDKDTPNLPELTLDWMQKYDKQEVNAWIKEEDERLCCEEEEKKQALKENSRRLIEARARERFGSFYPQGSQSESERAGTNSSDGSKIKWLDYDLPYFFLVILIAAIIGYFVYNSSLFEYERYEKEGKRQIEILKKAAASPITENITPDGLRFDMSEIEVDKMMKKKESYEADGSIFCDWLLGDVNYAGNELYDVKFYNGKLCSYTLTLCGRKENGIIKDLTDLDRINIVKYYKRFLKTGYTYHVVHAYYTGNVTYIITKNNLAIEINQIGNWIRILCENKPVSKNGKYNVNAVASTCQDDNDEHLVELRAERMGLSPKAYSNQTKVHFGISKEEYDKLGKEFQKNFYDGLIGDGAFELAEPVFDKKKRFVGFDIVEKKDRTFSYGNVLYYAELIKEEQLGYDAHECFRRIYRCDLFNMEIISRYDKFDRKTHYSIKAYWNEFLKIY